MARRTINDYKIEDLNLDEDDADDDAVLHPLYQEYLKNLEDVLPVYENVLLYQDDPNVVEIFLNEFMGINPQLVDDEKNPALYSYRKKIKGFHLAFNVRDPLVNSQLSKYKYQPRKNELTADQIKLKLAEKRLIKDQHKRYQEKLAEEKYKRDREALRKMHERLRK